MEALKALGMWEIVVLWSLCGVIGLTVGAFKERVFEGLVSGMLLGPVGVIYILCVSGRRDCPWCGERIDDTALGCPYCHQEIPPPAGRHRQ